MEYALADSRPKVLIADDERSSGCCRCSTACAPSAPLHADRRAHRPRPARRRRALGRRRAAGRRAGDAAGGRHRSRRRRHDLLHVGHHRLPQGRPDHPSRLGPQHPRTWCSGRWSRRRPRPRRSPPATCRPRRRRTAPPAQPVFMAPTPLFHVTACNCILHPCTLAGGRIVLTLQVGRRAGARADRARGRHQLLRRADDEPRAARPSRLGHA